MRGQQEVRGKEQQQQRMHHHQRHQEEEEEEGGQGEEEGREVGGWMRRPGEGVTFQDYCKDQANLRTYP